ncbi:MAG: ABC transporter ATP-binding protein [Christensenellales bacterium]|nr:ABC transporter ATP-binding protein [Christensenellales bacterium]
MIELKDIVVKFGDFEALHNINVNVKEGEFFTFLGPSGCGKTTTLRTITGFIEPVSGTVSVNNQDITHVPIEKRNIGIVFQSYALFPTMTVYDNIAFGLKLKKLKKPEIDQKVREIARKVDLSDEQLKKAVSQLSGGQQQRVAIARALVTGPSIICMDEPLSNLDAKLRVQLRNELKKMQREFGITTIYVTHDQEEALTMSDRVVVMNHGVIQQVGSPTDIYNEPVNAFVADFIGESNIIDGVMLEDCKVEFCGRTFECVDKGFEKNAPVDVVIRPEDLKIVYAGDGLLQGVVESIVFKGVHYEMMVRTQFFTFMVHSTMAESVGKTVGLSVIPFDIHIMHKSAEAEA